jgi:hypothetical protein
MTELQKTATFLVVAALLAGGAAVRLPGRSNTAADFNDQGQRFFPEFADPLLCTSLEVVDFDPATASALPFNVMFKDGKWVIPSHYDYPADGKDRLAKTASGVIGLRKDTIRSDRPDDQRGMGVIDPLDPKATSLEGRGKRVTLRDKSSSVLADFIIGKEVTGRPSQRYVRVPGKNRIYGVDVKVDLSTKFADWIETNLLKLETSRLRQVVFDNYKVDPQKGIEPGEVLEISKADSTAPWTLKGDLAADQELDTEKLSSMSTALGDLKIVGVRPKPPGLTKELKAAASKGLSLTPASVQSLVSKGYYLTRDGQLLSNQGDVRVKTDEGVVYTMRFGEVTFATGEALSAGKDEEKAAKAKSEGGGVESRYLFVTTHFDPSLIPETKPAPLPTPTLPEVFTDPFQRDPDDPKREAQRKLEKENLEKAKTEHDRKVADGEKRVKELTDRFAGWYYVVSGDAFKNVSLNRASLVRKKTEKPAASATPGSSPFSLPGGAVPPAAGPNP